MAGDGPLKGLGGTSTRHELDVDVQDSHADLLRSVSAMTLQGQAITAATTIAGRIYNVKAL